MVVTDVGEKWVSPRFFFRFWHSLPSVGIDTAIETDSIRQSGR